MSRSRQQLNKSIRGLQKVPRPIQGYLGNDYGIVAVPGRTNYVYVRLTGRPLAQVYNNRVPNIPNTPVLVGYDPIEPNLFQVLTVQSGNQTQTRLITNNMVGAHHKTHEWMGLDAAGGSDVVFVQSRQFMPLRVSPMNATGTFAIGVYRGFYYGDDEWMACSGGYLDMAPGIPATGARFMLIYLDSASGFPQAVTGTTKDYATLNIGDIPAPVPGTYPLAAIRMYEGQLGIYETRQYTDLVDLRFPGWHAATGTSSTFLGLTDTPDSYAGKGTWFTKVNAGATALEFVSGTPTTATIVAGWNDANTALVASLYAEISLPFAGTLTGWRLLADQTGAATVDIWKDSYANYPPTVADSICGGNYPTLTGEKGEDTTLAGWSKTFAAGEVMKFHLSACDTVRRLTLILTYIKT